MRQSNLYIVVVRGTLCLFLGIGILSLPATLAGQEPDRQSVECRGQIVRELRVTTLAPFPQSQSNILARAVRFTSRLHETTRPSVIRRYLALAVDRPCTELRRTESERILRAQPFIADATIVAYDDGPGFVVIEVTAVDEVSLVLDGSVSTSTPHFRAVRVGEGNLLGSGIYAAVRWANGRGFRSENSFRVAHHQLFGRPYQLVVQGGRRPVGHDWSVEAAHPYLTDLQRVAWRANFGVLDGYSFFERPADTAAALSLRRSFADIGGVVRVGGPRLLLLLGGSLSREHDETGQQPVTLVAGRILPDTSTVLMNRYPPHRQTRINALFGFRDLRFRQVTGFDALDGVEDIPQGVQFSGLLGRGFTMLDSKSDKGLFASASLYGGMGSSSSFAMLETSIEGRREPDSRRWVGVTSSARIATYAQPFPRHTLFGSIEWSGGWNARIPFQLTLGVRDGGLRGYRDSHVAGARRLVMRFEDRYVWGRMRQYATLGVGAFAEAGKIWAGDAPFGVNSAVRYSAGVSLLASIPPRSQRLLRLDVAYPLNSDVARGWEVRLTAHDATRLFWREPRDVRRVRERSVPSNVFNWP